MTFTPMHDAGPPLRIVNSTAPIRIVDNGGWTDTWFARQGAVFNIAVTPCAEVQVEVFRATGDDGHITVDLQNFGESVQISRHGAGWGSHPLLEAAIQLMQIPGDLALRITISSDAPAGASTGTSAAVTVALIGALDRVRGGRMGPRDVAYAAHHAEMEMVGLQCGIQDQLCSAHGGINFIEMDEFPRATVTPIRVPEHVLLELERRLILVYLGSSHSSSDLHAKVIRELESEGARSPRLEVLRNMASRSRDALVAGDFDSFGRVMIENTEAQGRLHPELIGSGARAVIEIARAHGASGWKVNGAGGEGGSVSLLASPLWSTRRAMIRDIEDADSGYRRIPVTLSPAGLRTWEWTP